MLKNLYLLFFCTTVLSGCANQEQPVDTHVREFKVAGIMSAYDLTFKLPSTFASAREIAIDQLTDTTNARLNWILMTQYQDESINCFFDTTDVTLNVIIKAGPRVDVSSKERKISYFAVPTVPLHKIFPEESAVRKILSDSGEKKYKEKKYFKRKYALIPDSLGYQDYYYITTNWQSVLVIVNSVKEHTLEKSILNYRIAPNNKDQ